MAFAADSPHRPTALAEINVTPLVDVMLVLLIIFMIATPVLTRSVPLELPQARDAQPPPPKVDPLRIHLRADGSALWNGAPLSMPLVDALLRAEAQRSPQPALEIESHPESRYDMVTALLASARNAGFSRIGFVDPS